MDYMLMPFRRYFDFAGRSRRKEYWMFALFNFLVQAVAVLIMLAVGINWGAGPDEVPMNLAFWFIFGLLFLYGLFAVIPSLAVTVRRLHDTNHSGWFYFLGLIPLVGGLILLYFFVIEGTHGPNAYGPDPKEGLPRGV